MKIAFSARGLSIPSGGVNQFIRSVVTALSAHIGDDEFFVFYNSGEFLGLTQNASEILINGKNRIFWDFVLLPRTLRKLGIDMAIFPKNVVPFFTGCPCYVVVHDLAYFDRQLNAYPLLDTVYMRSLIPQSLRRATGVFAVSEHTKRDITHYTKCKADKITVIYEAADPMYHHISDSSKLKRVKQKYALPERFIMYVGSLSPRKNIIRLLEAFHLIRQKLPHNLVLTGSKSWKDSAVYQTVYNRNLNTRINQLGYVKPEDMPVLYNLADLFVYPSLYEGFGLPVLEAMQCGCPVVASNTTSIPEVAGDAALLVDPLDIRAIADAMHRVIEDRELMNKLTRAGMQRAKQFSWDRTAKIMLANIRRYSKFC